MFECFWCVWFLVGILGDNFLSSCTGCSFGVPYLQGCAPSVFPLASHPVLCGGQLPNGAEKTLPWQKCVVWWTWCSLGGGGTAEQLVQCHESLKPLLLHIDDVLKFATKTEFTLMNLDYIWQILLLLYMGWLGGEWSMSHHLCVPRFV